MAVLQIRPRDPSQARSTGVRVTLVDSSQERVDGYVTATGAAVVVEYQGRTDAAGALDVELTPNADITPANTGYLVTLDGRRILIVKDGDTQTLYEAQVGDLDPLGPITPGTIDGGSA